MHRPHDREQLSHGERFTYRGHRCRITYDGLRPHFTVDGRNAADHLPEFEVTPENIGKTTMDWRHALMQAIDQYEGDDVNADEYLSPQARRALRTFSREFIDLLAEKTGSFTRAHEVLAATDDITDIQDRCRDRWREHLEEGHGIEARDRAREHVADELIDNHGN